MKKLLLAAGLSLACLSLASCGGKSEAKETYVSLDINPSLELIVDENNLVVEAYASNTDAKVLLHGEKDLKGMKIDAAISEIASLSIDLGYLSNENSVIEYTMSSNLSSKALGKLEANINASFDKEAKKANLEVKFDTDGTFTLERQLEHVKTKYPNDTNVQALTPQKYKLVLSAMATDFTLRFTDACALTEMELIDRIQATRDEAFNFATKAYNELAAASKIAYDKAKGSFLRGAYTTYYTAHMLDHKVNYGAIYSVYGMSADTLDGILQMSYLVDSYAKKVLADEDIQALVAEMKKLGITVDEKLSCLKDKETGKITIDSVNSYINKCLKNMDDKELGDALIDLNNSLNGLEDNINALIEDIASEHKDEIKAVADSLKSTVKSLEGVVNALLPDDLKAIINEYIAELSELSNTLSDACKGKVTLDNMKEYSNKLRAKEDEALAKINKDIPAKDMEFINSILDGMDKAVAQVKKTMEKAMGDAKSASDRQLAELRANLK